MELYLREGEIIGIIPVEKLSKKYGYLYESYTRNKEDAKKVVREHPYIFARANWETFLDDAKKRGLQEFQIEVLERFIIFLMRSRSAPARAGFSSGFFSSAGFSSLGFSSGFFSSSVMHLYQS